MSVEGALTLRTEAFFEKQALEEDVLGVSRLVSDAYLLISRAEAGLHEIHRP